MRLRYVIISMLLVFLSSAVMSAQDRDDLRQDTLSVYFDISDSRVDPSFMGNAAVLDTYPWLQDVHQRWIVSGWTQVL